MSENLRNIPALHVLLDKALVAEFGHAAVAFEARSLLGQIREEALKGTPIPDSGLLLLQLRSRLSSGVLPVINGTGVVLHTNLGRAPWSSRAQLAAQNAMNYAAVEVDVRSGKRGRRGGPVEDRLSALFGAEAALVVNNCAAAVLLALRTFARGKKVIVSRGELVEIGGGYRVPEVLSESGSEMVEVGTTNRTHLRDYEKALADLPPGEGVVLKVHQSNFRQEGFVTRPGLSELAQLPSFLLVDLGSGNVHPFEDEPSVTDCLKAGAPVVCFSGDKLLGGPQAGILVGQKEHIERARKCPLYRALRPDKVTLAAIGATADNWLLGEKVPLWEMMELDEQVLKTEVDRWVDDLGSIVAVSAQKVSGAVGGGSLPGKTWDSWALRFDGLPAQRVKEKLLGCEPAIYGFIKEDAFYLDARTVVPLGQSERLLQALRVTFGSS